MIALLVLLPIAAAGLAFAIPSNRWRPLVLPAAGAMHLALASWLLSQGDQWAFDRWLAIDPLSRLFVGYISLLFFLCAIYAPAYLRLRSERDNRVLCACLLAALGMMSLIAISHHLGLMWIAMEATTLATASGHLLQSQSQIAGSHLEILADLLGGHRVGTDGIVLSGVFDDRGRVRVDVVI